MKKHITTQNDKIVKQTYTDPITGKFVVGNPGGGRTPGSGYKQKFEQMLQQVADEKGITRETAELELFKTAYEQAVRGNYQFFKDYVDRAYGPVKTNDSFSIGEVDKLVIVVKE